MHQAQELGPLDWIVDRALFERFDQRLQRRDRRAQLVRDVGHEIAPRGLGAVQVGDILEHQELTLFGQVGGDGLDPARLAASAQLDQVGDRRGVARGVSQLDQLRVAYARQPAPVEPFVAEHARGAGVAEHDLVVGVQHDHAIGHVLEDGVHLGPLLFELFQDAPQATMGQVQAVQQRCDIGRRLADKIAHRQVGDLALFDAPHQLAHAPTGRLADLLDDDDRGHHGHDGEERGDRDEVLPGRGRYEQQRHEEHGQSGHDDQEYGDPGETAGHPAISQ